MNRSGSRTDLDELSMIGSMQNSGVDLTNYKDQLQKDRNSRTLNLRSMKRPSISGLRNANFQIGSLRNSSLVDLNLLPFMTPENVIQTFQSGDESAVFTLIGQISQTANETPRLVSRLCKTTEIFQPIIDCLNGVHTWFHFCSFSPLFNQRNECFH